MILAQIPKGRAGLRRRLWGGTPVIRDIWHEYCLIFSKLKAVMHIESLRRHHCTIYERRLR